MMSRTIVGLVTLLSASLSAGSAAAAVVLESAELATGNGFRTNPLGPPPYYRPTTFDPPVPFPNDAQNFARVGPQGLEVLVNRVASVTHDVTGNFTGDWWSAEKFAVVFQLDEPAPFTLSRTYGNDGDFRARLTLQAEGQPPIPNLPSPVQPPLSGTLPAGRYTFSGLMDYEMSLPNFPVNMVERGGFHNLRLTVVPEPGALGLLAVAAGAALGRRRCGR